MIFIGKAPYRISLLGGGSDLDWFIEKEDYGVSIGYSLDKFSYTVINKLPKTSNKGIIKYSSIENYSYVEEITHPLIRESLKILKIKEPLEIATFGFASGGSGIGGSSSFLLSLLRALSESHEIGLTNVELAKLACKVEIEILKKPIGRQDQYISALGGLSCLRFERNGKVTTSRLSPNKENVIRRISENLYLIPSFLNRKADKVLHNLKKRDDSYEQIKEIRSIAKKFILSDEVNEEILINQFNDAVLESWEIKKNMANVMNEDLNQKFTSLNSKIPNNWIRLVGAGSGGYFLISVKEDVENIGQLFLANGINSFLKANISDLGVNGCEF